MTVEELVARWVERARVEAPLSHSVEDQAFVLLDAAEDAIDETPTPQDVMDMFISTIELFRLVHDALEGPQDSAVLAANFADLLERALTEGETRR